MDCIIALDTARYYDEISEEYCSCGGEIKEHESIIRRFICEECGQQFEEYKGKTIKIEDLC